MRTCLRLLVWQLSRRFQKCFLQRYQIANEHRKVPSEVLICLERLTAEPNPDRDSMIRRSHAILSDDMWSEKLSFL